MISTSKLLHLLSLLLLLVVGVSLSVQAQEKIIIQANARGTSTQMGRILPVKISIDQISTDEDQRRLIEGFTRSGQDGMVDVLRSMSQKGRISLEGRVGMNPVSYIRELPSENGRRFRLVTDRYVTIGELSNSTRSSEYNIGAVELTITPDGKGSGTLLPACKLKVNKQNQIEIETYQNPWQLTDFIVTYGK